MQSHREARGQRLRGPCRLNWDPLKGQPPIRIGVSPEEQPRTSFAPPEFAWVVAFQKGRAVTYASYQCAKPQFIRKWKFAFYFFKLQTKLKVQESVPLKSHSGRRQGREKESHRERVCRGTCTQG